MHSILPLKSQTHSLPACHKVNCFVASSIVLFFYNIVPISAHSTVFRFQDGAEIKDTTTTTTCHLKMQQILQKSQIKMDYTLCCMETHVCQAPLLTIT